jgi:crotonobetainyl-CoA:carnitine CoA-transferase CaiB-like acyl-CoA transferase
MVAMLDFQATRWLIGGEVAPQAGNDHPTAFPMGVFPVKDGHISIAAAGDRMFLDFLKVIGAEDLIQDERFATREERGKHRPALRALVEERTRTWTADDLIEALNAVGVPSGPILTIDKVFENPQVRHLGLAQEIESERYGKKLTLVRSPVRLSRPTTALRRAAPAPGADTDLILKEYGYTAEEISALRASGAAGVDPDTTRQVKGRSK